MPVYEYTALSDRGKSLKGSIDADNVRAARQKLRAKGVFPTDIREGGNLQSGGKSRDLRRYLQSNSVSTSELAIATRQLSTLVGAGLPLVSALQALSEQTESRALQRIIVNVREKVQEGSALAKAISSYPRAFPRLYVNLVASGEASGTLDSVLENLAEHLESQMALRRKVTSAMFYPILMLCVCVAVIVALLILVVPRIVSIFERQNLTLPWPTRLVLGVSNFFTAYWPFVVVLLVASLVSLRWYYRQETGKNRIDNFLLQLPIFGKLYIKVATARISRTLSTLLSSGVQLLTALDIARNIVSNVHVAAAMENAREGVREGRSLAKEISKSGIFPQMVCHMIAVGEQSGELESMLGRVAKAYENEVDAALSGITSLLEPLMMIFVGGIVLLIVISVLLPMADMIGKIG
ncbi:MAG: type II secretion system inner membrane protein GspF [Bdellovibrionales bacterium]|nr:type II secretion system inner membrane protein GspF [Bdellovibrionales bacterium]